MGYKRNSLEWEPTLPLTLRWPLCHSEAHTELGGGTLRPFQVGGPRESVIREGLKDSRIQASRGQGVVMDGREPSPWSPSLPSKLTGMPGGGVSLGREPWVLRHPPLSRWEGS